MMKQNYFPTLNAALEAEGLHEAWKIHFSPINYGENVSWTWDDGSRHGHYISIYRTEEGLYERPVHYKR
jgi:surface antigen